MIPRIFSTIVTSTIAWEVFLKFPSTLYNPNRNMDLFNILRDVNK